MKTKTLAVTNGVVGLIGGIFLLFAFWFIVGVASSGSEAAIVLMTLFVYLVKLALLVLGIVGAVYYKLLLVYYWLLEERFLLFLS